VTITIKIESGRRILVKIILLAPVRWAWFKDSSSIDQFHCSGLIRNRKF